MMKKLATILIAACAAALVGAEVTLANKAVSLKYADGAVELYAAGAEKPTAVFTPAFPAGAEIKATIVDRKSYKIMSLRSGVKHIAFKLENLNDPAFTLSLNGGVSPVTVAWNAQAVVIPDRFAEDQVVIPGEGVKYLPPCATLYLALLDDGNAALACIPVKAGQAAELSGDLKTLKLNQRNTEDYIFVLNQAPGAWTRTKLPGKPGETKTLDWKRPYPALWRVAMPVEKDFIAPGDGSYVAWNIIVVPEKKGRAQDNPQRGSIQEVKTRRYWLGGFEGMFRYPVEFLDEKVVLTHPDFGVNKKIVHSTARDAFIYTVQRNAKTPEAMKLPFDFLPPWETGHDLYRATNFGISPTTCATTHNFEKIFYHDEAQEKRGEIVNSLGSMQFFVESMRSRVENARVWKREIEEFADGEAKLHPEIAPAVAELKTTLAEIERLYADSLPRIQTTDVVEKLSAEVIALTDGKLDAEVMEKKALDLGRAIRTIGGGQDNLAAFMRHVGKCVRYQALTSYMNAKEPAVRKFWGEIFVKAEPMLQGFYGHDGK